MKIRITRSDGATSGYEVRFGELKTIALGRGEKAMLEVIPRRGLDVGMGRGRTLETEVIGGELGLILEARGRPLSVPAEKDILVRWRNSLTEEQQPSS